MPALPPGFLERMQPLLGAALEEFAAVFEQPARVGLRANTLKIAPEELAARLPYDLEPLAWAKGGFLIRSPHSQRPHPQPLSPYGESGVAASPGKHPYHAAGLYYLQEPSAMAVAPALDPQPGERVLDLCAAPGGKTTQIAALMQGRGLLVANEVHPQRVRELAENLERCGVTHAVVLNETPQRLAGHFGAFFDRVLVDAPCSGEGMFRKSEAARRDWSPALVQSCATRQAGILDEAARLVRPGGRLVYSTCTFNLEENEASIAAFLKRRPDFGLLPAPAFAGRASGLVEAAGDDGDLGLRQALRLWPHMLPGDGHFVAVLQRLGEVGVMESREPAGQPPGAGMALNSADLQALREFTRLYLRDDPLAIEAAPERLRRAGKAVYRLPEKTPALAGLRCLHPGWWLGMLHTAGDEAPTGRKGDRAFEMDGWLGRGRREGGRSASVRFEPSHALALGLPPGASQLTFDLGLDDPALTAFLRGETLDASGPAGWLLVQVDGWGLGWGKRVQGRIKNYYPRGLRQA